MRTIEIVNNPLGCDIRIIHTESGLVSPDVTKIVIQKYDPVVGEWKHAYEKFITTSTDADFTLSDIYVASLHEYSYKMIYIDSDSTILDEVERTVKCNFDGLVVMDSYGNTYNAVANWNYTHSREGGAGFIQPFFSRFPIAIYNGNVNYESGNASGLFAPFDSKGNPVYDNLTLYRHRLIDYLTDHRVKLFKTYDGYMWLVAIDSGVQDAYDGHLDSEVVSFDWREVQEIPTTDMMRVIA